MGIDELKVVILVRESLTQVDVWMLWTRGDLNP